MRFDTRASHEESVTGALGCHSDWQVARGSGEVDITWEKGRKRRKRWPGENVTYSLQLHLVEDTGEQAQGKVQLLKARPRPLGVWLLSVPERQSSGDEYVGLVQAMLTTGVPVLIASLWKVEDPVTRALFKTFYAGLAVERTPVNALQEAARTYEGSPGGHNFTSRLPFRLATWPLAGEKKTICPLTCDNI